MVRKVQAPSRPDIDILDELPVVINGYPPLRHDRKQMQLSVRNGVIYAEGNTKTTAAKAILQQQAARLDGVLGVDVTKLYDDDTLRLAVGRVLPAGVNSTLEYGVVILTGHLPQVTTEKALISQINRIKGVRQVISRLR